MEKSKNGHAADSDCMEEGIEGEIGTELSNTLNQIELDR
jgi:hypothetical protein